MIKIKKINFLLILISVFLLCSCNDNNIEKSENNGVRDKTIKEESLEEKFTVGEVVEYLCSEEIEDREYNKEGNQKAAEYIDELYKELDLEFVFGKSYLDNFLYDDINLSNVVGKISGKDNSTAIILTAHFDAWFNGAVDNASGVATVLEIAKLLKDTSKKEALNYDVIFLMTNGEMALFSGSRDFVTKIEQLQYQSVFNINIDCVGMKDSYNSNSLGLKNLSRISESQILYSDIKEIFNDNSIDFVDDYPTEKAKMAFEQNMGVSDYFSFEENGYANIHICQQGISEFILNEKDTPELIDYKKIEQLADVLSLYIKNIKL